MHIQKLYTNYNYYKNIKFETVINSKSYQPRDFVENSNNPHVKVSFKGKDSKYLKFLISLFDKVLKEKNHSKILDKALSKLISLKTNTQDAIPYLELMLNRDFFNPFTRTKKKIFKAFMQIDSENEKFLTSIKKISTNPIEANLYREEIEELLKTKKFKNDKTKAIIIEIRNLYNANKTISLNISNFTLNRINISRTITNIDSNTRDKAYENYLLALNFFKSSYKTKEKPDINDLIILHKIITKDIPYKNRLEHQGVIRGSSTDSYKSIKYSKNFIPTEKVLSEMHKFETWYNDNYYTSDSFMFVANINKKLMKLHPFYDANGRTIRLFLDWVLASKGYLMKEYPEKYAISLNTPLQELRKIIAKSCVPINELNL